MIPFFKLTGGGNDFLALVEFESEPAARDIRAWCSRRLSIGADGLFLLSPDSEGARMTYFNADGAPARLCLNGTRCAARLAFELGWAERRMVIQTGAGPVTARLASDDRVSVVLPEPIPQPVDRSLEADGRSYRGWSVAVGVPHFVLAWPESLDRAPVEELGPVLRSHPDLGPEGANVHFVSFPTSRLLEIRSFERGVEAETLACGSGILAASATGLVSGRLRPPARVVTRGGSPSEVAREGERWVLTGEARLVARGELTVEASSVPAPPTWSRG